MRSSVSSARRWSPAPAKLQAASSVVVTSCALPASPAVSCERAAANCPWQKARAASARPRQAVVGIAGDQPLGERKSVDEVAVDERGGEGALDEVDVARIGAQRLAGKDRRGGRVALGAGDQRREVIARLALADLDGRLDVGLRGGGAGRADQGQAAPRRDECNEQRRAGAVRRDDFLHDAGFPFEAQRGERDA